MTGGAPTTGPSLVLTGAGQIAVRGPVTFATAGTLLEAGRPLFAGQPAMTVNLRQVTQVDSAGLALLLEWLRQARGERRTVRFDGVPDKLLAIARLSGVEGLLGPGYWSAGLSTGSSAGSSASPSSSSDSSR